MYYNVLQRVIRCITDSESKLPNPYMTFIDELSVVDGVLLTGQKVVAPDSFLLADQRQEIQRINHNKRATRPLAPLVAGQDIRVRDFQTNTWQPAKVITTDVHPRSYNVLTPTGNVLRRNRRHLRKTSERHTTRTFQQSNDDDTRRDDLTLRVDTRTDDLARRDDTRRDDVRRRDENRVMPPPDDLTRRDDIRDVQPSGSGNDLSLQKKTVRFQLPQPMEYTRSGRRVKCPDRLGF